MRTEPALSRPAVDVDALAKLREAARHAHEPECCERCEAGERFHAGAVCAGAGCDPLVQCLRCGMPLPNHMPHDADCDAVLTITVPVLAEVRRGRALREAVEGLAEEHDSTHSFVRIDASTRTPSTGIDLSQPLSVFLRSALAAGDGEQ